jgi:hypothetical protein
LLPQAHVAASINMLLGDKANSYINVQLHSLEKIDFGQQNVDLCAGVDEGLQGSGRMPMK